jgi:hypothetical protein
MPADVGGKGGLGGGGGGLGGGGLATLQVMDTEPGATQTVLVGIGPGVTWYALEPPSALFRNMVTIFEALPKLADSVLMQSAAVGAYETTLE